MPTNDILKEMDDRFAQLNQEMDERFHRTLAEADARAERVIRETDARFATIAATDNAVAEFKRAFGIGDPATSLTWPSDNNSPQPKKPAVKFDPSQATIGKDIGSGASGKISWVEQEGVGPLVVKTPLGSQGEDDLKLEYANYQLAGSHPNLLQCHGIQKIDGKEGLVLEGIKGRTMSGTLRVLEGLTTTRNLDSKNKDVREEAQIRLTSAVKSHGLSKAISQEEYVGATQYMALEILSGLAHLEECGVVHNDIRPDNIMIDEETGNVKIVDLGNAQQSGTDPKLRNAPWKTGTVSPDRALDKQITPKHDVFALGATTYEAQEHDQFRFWRTDGEFPTSQDVKAFRDADSHRETKQALHKAAETEYTRFINTMMHPDPTKRPSAKALLATVRELDKLPEKEREEVLVRLEKERPGSGIRFLAQRLGDPTQSREILKQVLAADRKVQQQISESISDIKNTSYSKD